ncbi:phosphoribosylformimino-5-aminoimidazole carboxamide ribotide isomerase [Methanobrevibacter olleyae]|uniref:Phosphoribosylformimino-5-aminoimidazole carboxamide ribotide isomerase n=1 Tax=Methanobrevibacter olleyae TaxID=294671 RepID=A0A1I4I4M4_METOL|nr:HisA/HisF family protein [Methanobrevibacter olleyae]SFL49214.1 phosphoribosylformimino-5-aminoimidazole carboxamide ribotide isomerase [Methanobrevibacter olleyae]
MLEIIPVMDLMNSVAVFGKSGDRENYAPLQSIYANSPDPLEIAASLKRANAKEIYIADLDLIERNGNHNIYKIKEINTILPVILDVGVDNLETFEFLLDFAYKIIVATETLDSIEELEKIFDKYPKERIIISVDVKNNELYTKNMDLNLEDFKEVLRKIDPNEIILLDISSVGTEGGYNKELLESFEEFRDKIILGGGITKDEIEVLSNLGIKKALVGTALHKGEIKIHNF